ncbi:hypothetical protein [Lentibacter algarum]|uniref:hypothetical protein n=1 Tax=Lentibacter algarum TaxID=576131 RepID=UPI00249025D0|nr:hypothetical protein [Lentibacter algarum]
MPTIYLVQHSELPEERDAAFTDKDKAAEYLATSLSALSGEAWMRNLDYDLSEDGVRQLLQILIDEYTSN